MKKNSKQHIEKIIKDDVTHHTPDVIKAIDFNEAFTPLPAKPSIFRRKLSYGFAASFAAIVILLIAVIGPADPLEPTNGETPRRTLELSSKEEFYSLGAFSAVTLLDQSLEANTPTLNQPNLTLLSSQNTLIEKYLDFINGYINLVEPIMMGEDSLSFRLHPSPLDDYDYSVQLSSIDLSGETHTRTLHYNETEVSEDEYVINGIMIMNNVTYSVKGDIEIDGDEIDMTLKASHPDNEDTYLEIQQTIEDDEQTLEYEFVRNGDTVFESSLEIEFDDDEIVAEIEHETPMIEIELVITRNLLNNPDTLKIEYEIDSERQGDEEGEIQLSVIYDEATQRYAYKYSITIEDGASFSVIKPRHYQND